MTAKHLLSFSIILLYSLDTFGQQTINGTILNSKTQEPIQYANIGLNNANIGTISNTDGSFSLNIPEKYYSDTLIVSSIGFAKEKIAVSYFLKKKSTSIYLNEKITELSNVVVSSKKGKAVTFELGNADFKGGVLQTDTLYAGRSVALLIENTEINIKKGKTFPAFIENARLRIFRNNLRSFKYRIRLNEVDRLTGKPGQDLLDTSIIIESSMRNGWLNFDLSGLKFEVGKPFFVTFEQLLDLTDRTLIANDYNKFLSEHPDKVKIDTVEVDGKKEVRKIFKGNGIDLAGTFIGIAVSKTAKEQYTCYVRETSHGEWKKVHGIVAATVILSSYPEVDTKK